MQIIKLLTHDPSVYGYMSLAPLSMGYMSFLHICLYAKIKIVQMTRRLWAIQAPREGSAGRRGGGGGRVEIRLVLFCFDPFIFLKFIYKIYLKLLFSQILVSE
jgi:hypothetical protein